MTRKIITLEEGKDEEAQEGEKVEWKKWNGRGGTEGRRDEDDDDDDEEEEEEEEEEEKTLSIIVN